MGLFDLPSGELELHMDGKWKSVMFNDRLTNADVERAVNNWSDEHEVDSARYTPPGDSKSYTVWGKVMGTRNRILFLD